MQGAAKKNFHLMAGKAAVTDDNVVDGLASFTAIVTDDDDVHSWQYSFHSCKHWGRWWWHGQQSYHSWYDWGMTR